MPKLGFRHSIKSRKQMSFHRLGENNPNYKGGNIKYGGLHDWIRKKLGIPDTCEHCGKTKLSGHSIQWANKNGQYDRNLKNWIRLCAKCHCDYDKKLGVIRGRKKGFIMTDEHKLKIKLSHIGRKYKRDSKGKFYTDS